MVSRGILHATVRMMDKPALWVVPSHRGHAQALQDKSADSKLCYSAFTSEVGQVEQLVIGTECIRVRLDQT